jgi:hypothetical protein
MHRTRKRIWLGLLGLLLVLGTTSSVLFLATRTNKLNKANFDNLEEGMTQREVEIALGGSYDKQMPVLYSVGGMEMKAVLYKGKEKGPRTFIMIYYADGALSHKDYIQETIPGFFSRLKTEIGF